MVRGRKATPSRQPAFEEALLQAGLPLARANPLQARRFAQAMGQRAKTDAVDARVLAQMGTALHLRPTEASSPTQRALEELQMARDALVTDRTAARNRQKHLRHRLLRQQSKTRLSQIDRHLAAVDAEIGKRLAEDVVLARRTEIMTSIPGLSSITAAGLLTQMPELGRLDAKAVASLAGLAPVTRQSGAWQGRSFIQGGRPRVRRLLYMPALAAIRCNPDWGAPSFLGHGLRENPMSPGGGGMVRSRGVKGAGSAPTEGARRATGVGADAAAMGSGALVPGQRWSASRKRDVVLRLLRGEPLDAVSRELGVEVYRLERWKVRALAGLELGLKEQAGEPLAAELDAAKRHIGELSMDNELLRSRARAAERRLPLATRRSRR